MKRFAVTLLAVVFILAGCGKSDSTTPTKDNDNSAQVSYTINNIKIIPGTDFSGAYKELGEPVKYTEAASCYFDGMDKVLLMTDLKSGLIRQNPEILSRISAYRRTDSARIKELL